VGAEAEELRNALGGEHLMVRAAGDEPARRHDVEAVTVRGGQVEVVDRSQCRVAESADQAENLQLVADVEVVGGLVEQVQVAALGEGVGDEEALLSPPESVA